MNQWRNEMRALAFWLRLGAIGLAFLFMLLP